MVVNKAVTHSAGTGTRLLMATKEMPKGMLSVFAKGISGVEIKSGTYEVRTIVEKPR
jgi:dTDP-glucose pyrophosphorylase